MAKINVLPPFDRYSCSTADDPPPVTPISTDNSAARAIASLELGVGPQRTVSDFIDVESLLSGISGCQQKARSVSLPCRKALAHVLLVGALAAGDLFHGWGPRRGGLQPERLGVLVALLYAASASLPLLAELLRRREVCLPGFPWLILAVIHTGVSLASAWRRTGSDSDVSARAANMMGILQLETMLMHGTSVAASICTSSLSLLALAALTLARPVAVDAFSEGALLVLSIGFGCAMSSRRPHIRSAKDLCLELKEGLWAGRRDPELLHVTKFASNVRFADVFCPLLTGSSAGTQSSSVVEQLHVGTRLDHLIVRLSKSKENIEHCKLLQPELRITLVRVFQNILQELRSTSSLQSVTCSAAGLASCSKMMLDFVHTALTSNCAPDECVKNAAEPSCDSMSGSISTENFIFDDAVSRLMSCLNTQATDSKSPPRKVPCGAGHALGDDFGRWHLDIVRLSQACGDRPLTTVSRTAILWCSEGYDVSSLDVFLTDIEGRYNKSNAYHNSMHAADVVNNMVYFYNLDIGKAFDTFEKMTGIVAALAHDVGHSGKSNIFHSIAQTPLTLLFNDQSVQENMHCTILFAVLRVKSSNFLRGMNSTMWMKFRSSVIQMILETDLAKHVQLVSNFRQQILDGDRAAGASGERLAPNQQRNLLSFILKCSDLGHSTKQFNIHSQWTLRISDEFYRQGDAECALGLPCSPFCDRKKTNICESQQGFFSFIAIPLFRTMSEYLQSHRLQFELINTLDSNDRFWKLFDGADFSYVDPMGNYELLQLAHSLGVQQVKSAMLSSDAGFFSTQPSLVDRVPSSS